MELQPTEAPTEDPTTIDQCIALCTNGFVCNTTCCTKFTDCSYNSTTGSCYGDNACQLSYDDCCFYANRSWVEGCETNCTGTSPPAVLNKPPSLLKVDTETPSMYQNVVDIFNRLAKSLRGN